MTAIDNFILEQAKIRCQLTTWWHSDFYEAFCKEKGLDYYNDPVEKVARSIRYHCNRLVDKGLLQKERVGTGLGGRTDFNHSHGVVWSLVEQEQADRIWVRITLKIKGCPDVFPRFDQPGHFVSQEIGFPAGTKTKDNVLLEASILEHSKKLIEEAIEVIIEKDI